MLSRKTLKINVDTALFIYVLFNDASSSPYWGEQQDDW
jgi:hypothetical protein